MNTKRVEEQVNLLVPNCTCKYIRETQHGTWKCDQWEFTINGEKFDFFTGLGHRGLTEKAKREIEEEYPPPRFLGTQAYEDYLAALDAARVPKPPHVASLLFSLIMDSKAATQSFEDWCEEYGDSPDSRKALERYNKLAHLRTLLEDY